MGAGAWQEAGHRWAGGLRGGECLPEGLSGSPQGLQAAWHSAAVTAQHGGHGDQAAPSLSADTSKPSSSSRLPRARSPYSLPTNFTEPRGKFLIPSSKCSLFNQPPIIQFGRKLKPGLAFHATFPTSLLLGGCSVSSPRGAACAARRGDPARPPAPRDGRDAGALRPPHGSAPAPAPAPHLLPLPKRARQLPPAQTTHPSGLSIVHLLQHRQADPKSITHT